MYVSYQPVRCVVSGTHGTKASALVARVSEVETIETLVSVPVSASLAFVETCGLHFDKDLSS